MNAPEHDRPYALFAFTFLILLTAFRIVYAWAGSLDLAPDEAYYWDWSRNLAWGYYSKPPMVAWLYAAATYLGGDSTLTVRATSALIMLGTMSGLFFLCKALFSARVGFWTVVAASLTPGVCAASAILTIDAPLLFFWTWTCLLFYWAVTSNNVLLWILTGLFLGAGFLSKQVMLGFLPLSFAALALNGRYRRRLISWPYIMCALIGLCMLLPPILWNYQHDWVTFRHTAHHVEVKAGHPFRPGLFFEYLGAQAGVITPVLFVLLFAAGWRLLKSGKLRQNFAFLYLAVLSYPALIAFQALSLFSRVHPNWPAPFYITAFALGVAWALDPAGAPGRRKALRAGVAVGLVFTFFTYFPGTLGALGFPLNAKTDPTYRLRGWAELGSRVGDEVRELRDKYGWDKGSFIIASDQRQLVSELAFYLPGRPEVFVWPRSPKINSQYHLLPGLPTKIGANVLFVTPADRPPPEDLESHFDAVEFIKRVDVSYQGEILRGVDLYLGFNLKSVPRFYEVFPELGGNERR